VCKLGHQSYTLSMKLQWDKKKASRNRQKHGITFEEAAAVFADPLALIFDDEWHSVMEEREIIIGHSTDGHLLLVSFVERTGVVRIISARRATKKERENYEENAY
jgi:uncharacterized protein